MFGLVSLLIKLVLLPFMLALKVLEELFELMWRTTRRRSPYRRPRK